MSGKSLLHRNCTLEKAMVELLLLLLLLADTVDIVSCESSGSCKPRKMWVPTHPNGKYFPYYYQLHRCSGGTQNPGTHRCWPIDMSTLQVYLRNSAGETEAVALSNHTRCREFCVCGPCREYDGIPDSSLCKPMERWDPDSCRCLTNCPKIEERGRRAVRSMEEDVDTAKNLQGSEKPTPTIATHQNVTLTTRCAGAFVSLRTFLCVSVGQLFAATAFFLWFWFCLVPYRSEKTREDGLKTPTRRPRHKEYKDDELTTLVWTSLP